MNNIQKKLRALAVYLPQYHPIPENDEWWGNGFTEWRNVVKGSRIVKGQYQPHLPKDLGYYDLRLAEIREQQAQLAKANGIYGFCYYHYWFSGKRMIERPFNEVLASKKPDFPFCLCWANESWSRNWDGMEKQILIKQEYSKEDDLNHIKYLCEEVFPDERYIKIDGKPVFIFYRPSSMPDIKETAKLWREEVKHYGYKDIYLMFFWSFDRDRAPDEFGLDAAAQFTPHPIRTKRKNYSIVNKALNKFGINLKLTNYTKHIVYEYKNLVKAALKFIYPKTYTLYPSVTPMWDNYARRKLGGAKIYVNSTPELYEHWLSEICKKWEPPNSEENFLFINAWNEWAEGNHLEPCEKWGDAYLKATKKVLDNYK